MSVINAVRGAAEGGGSSSGPARVVERDHELRAGLFAMEVTAGVLSRDRDRISSADVDVLMDGLIAEIARMRALLEETPAAPISFDLGVAIAGAVACARGTGLIVHDAIPAGVEVLGRPDIAAQVLVALLDNIRRHATSSPVELGVALDAGMVVLTVADRGPGVDAAVRDRLFDQGVRCSSSDGSGLGLYIARRLITDEGGELSVEARPGGGATFAVKFPAAPTR